MKSNVLSGSCSRTKRTASDRKTQMMASTSDFLHCMLRLCRDAMFVFMLTFSREVSVVGVMNGSTSDIACMINSSVTCSQTCSVTRSDKQNESSSRKRRRVGSKKSCKAGCIFLQDTNCEWELEWSETFQEPSPRSTPGGTSRLAMS